MCGVVGFWDRAGLSQDEGLARLRAMRERLRHRGPDAAGEYADGGLFLGHRRLSILDLSEAGAQPMRSVSGRWVLSYNGEVYNFRALRSELGDDGFTGHSDTEVLLAGIERWGLRGTLERSVGMFAFALWDARERRLTLGRDRLGIKPLYWARGRGGVLLFGSELSALEEHPALDTEIDRDALAAYLRFNCVPTPRTIYRGAHKVQPGTLLSFDAPDASPRVEVFWSAEEVARRGLAHPLIGSEDALADRVEAVLRDAVRDRLVADVPLGAFLSGGIDSSTVVALMQAQSDRPVRTFSIGNEREDYDEGVAAAAVAEHLGTEHTGLVVSAEEARAVIPLLPAMFDEPFADSSQIPTHLVSRLAREHVTVALSGDGGDELFGGYNRHFWGPRVWRAARLVPRRVRSAVALAMRTPSAEAYDRLFAMTPGAPRIRLPGQQMHKLAGVVDARSSDDLYARLCTHWSEPLVLGAARWERPEPRLSAGLSERMMLTDLVTYLPDDILTKVDRASMAVSLEARVPILDHRVVELAWRLPLESKIRGTDGKRVLKRVLERHVPRALWDRPKMGFGVPIGDWLRGPLREWAEGLLDPARLRREGVLRPEPIERRWREHLAGVGNWQHHLWDVLMFQAWREAR